MKTPATYAARSLMQLLKYPSVTSVSKSEWGNKNGSNEELVD